MTRNHNYCVTIKWTGNKGQGTINYSLYERSHIIAAKGRADIAGSSDPAFRGDPAMYTPEDLLVASLAACHMLWYLHLCAEAGVVVIDYYDNATGILAETEKGGGQFTEVTLWPAVTVAEASMTDKANKLHEKANELCYIANSCKFPVYHKPSCNVLEAADI